MIFLNWILLSLIQSKNNEISHFTLNKQNSTVRCWETLNPRAGNVLKIALKFRCKPMVRFFPILNSPNLITSENIVQQNEIEPSPMSLEYFQFTNLQNQTYCAPSPSKHDILRDLTFIQSENLQRPICLITEVSEKW